MEKDRISIEGVIAQLDEKKRLAMEETWKKVCFLQPFLCGRMHGKDVCCFDMPGTWDGKEELLCG